MTVSHLRPGTAVEHSAAGGPPRIAVVGGGIAGLAGAHFLCRAGARVTLFESSDQLGGLGTFFEYEGKSLERFYHVMLPSDEHLLPLLERLGIASDVYWGPSSLALWQQGGVFPLNGPADLLRYRALPVADRLRLGLSAIWAAHVSRGESLDDVTIEHWLTRLSGARAFDRFWRPLLESKFGSGYARVPALWYWSRFRREKGTGKEVKGYIAGGYKRIVDALTTDLSEAGARILLRTAVERVEGDESGIRLRVSGEDRRFDQVLLATPYPVVPRILGAELASALPAESLEIDYVGVLNVIVFLKRSASPHYWMPIVGESVPFKGVVETTNLIDRASVGGHHLVYLLNYLHRSDPRFALDDSSVADSYIDGLLRIFPHLTHSDVHDHRVFRTPFVEPIYTTGFRGRQPPSRIPGPAGVFLATTAQVYPDVTSWNSSVGLARRVVDQMRDEWSTRE